MKMASYQLLEPRDEDELHKARLLNVEEKPFKRISKRLLAPSSLLTTSSKLPTPPPDSISSDSQSTSAEIPEKLIDEWKQYREDILLDFAAFDSSLVRIQFLRSSNERERERYRTDKARIMETAQQVRDNTAQLRIQLEEAKQTLERRKKFDELAEKITGNRLLRPREDQMANLRKLEEECRELERESKNYKITWGERREQFGRIVEEGMQLRRLIRDEKEEVERREGMAENEDGEAGDDGTSGQTPRTPQHLNDRTETNGSKSRTGIAKIISRSENRSMSNSFNQAFSEGGKRISAGGNEDTVMTDFTDIETLRGIIRKAEAVSEDRMDTT